VAEREPEVGLGEWRHQDGLVWWEATLGGARLAFTTRVGGGSDPPYDTLNLGLHVGDAPDVVAANRGRLRAAALSVDALPVVAEQVHGVAAAVVGAADAGRGWQARETAVPETDALVTQERGVSLAILVADCAPVALVAPGGELGLAHAGWRGLAHGVLEATLQRLAELGAGPPERLNAVVGPCIRGCCYEVGEEVWRHFPESCLVPADRATPDRAASTSSASPVSARRRLDLMAAVVHRLGEAGIPAPQIHALGLCTACHSELFFSHRRASRDGLPATGRMALLGQRLG
jgi:YfiH family protein